MNKVGYKSSNKKVIKICLICGALLLFSMIPITLIRDTDIRAIYIIVTTSSLGLICMHLIKKAKNVFCPKCNTDLYNIIDESIYYDKTIPTRCPHVAQQ